MKISKIKPQDVSFPNSLVRPAVQKLASYSSARSLVQLNRGIFLDANENPLSQNYNRYPEPQPSRLVDELAALYKVSPREIFVGRGSDEAIDTLIRSFVDANESVLICPPTYGVYQFYAALQGAHIISVPLLDENSSSPFQLDLPALEKIAEGKPESIPKIIFLCTPNNPTGNLLNAKDVEKACELFNEKSIVVVDEAYLEFSDAKSFSQQLNKFPHLVVLRTLSKSWGLAGVRCGVALSNPHIIAVLQKVRAPYPLSTPAVEVILRTLSEPKMHTVQKAEILKERSRLCEALKTKAAVEKVFSSDANFILARVKNGQGLVSLCRENRILIRDRGSELGLENCVRISVGTRSENDKFLKMLTLHGQNNLSLQSHSSMHSASQKKSQAPSEHHFK